MEGMVSGVPAVRSVCLSDPIDYWFHRRHVCEKWKAERRGATGHGSLKLQRHKCGVTDRRHHWSHYMRASSFHHRRSIERPINRAAKKMMDDPDYRSSTYTIITHCQRGMMAWIDRSDWRRSLLIKKIRLLWILMFLSPGIHFIVSSFRCFSGLLGGMRSTKKCRDHHLGETLLLAWVQWDRHRFRWKRGTKTGAIGKEFSLGYAKVQKAKYIIPRK